MKADVFQVSFIVESLNASKVSSLHYSLLLTSGVAITSSSHSSNICLLVIGRNEQESLMTPGLFSYIYLGKSYLTQIIYSVPFIDKNHKHSARYTHLADDSRFQVKYRLFSLCIKHAKFQNFNLNIVFGTQNRHHVERHIAY